MFLGPARFRGAHGGRGSAKTRTFAKMAALHGAKCALEGREGIILCARAFQNSLDDSSLAEVKAAIAGDLWLRSQYVVTEKTITTRDGRVSFKFAGLTHNIESVKSKSRILLCWVDEAEEVSEAAWIVLIPTVREDESEIWVTWNPKRKKSATNKRFREAKDDDMKIVEMNWRDNPFFPDVLEVERKRDLRDRPAEYPHIWEGDYQTVYTGAYYAKHLADAKNDGRICRLRRDPMFKLRAYWDIGGPKKTADAMAIWLSQFVGKEIWNLAYKEGQGQLLAYYVAWFRDELKLEPHEIEHILPHDGVQVHADNPTGISVEDQLRNLGYRVRVIKNQGAGAAMQRITIARRQFHRVWFDAEKCEDGLEALGAYQPNLSEDEREADMGPLHNWASHGADAFGLQCVDYKEPSARIEKLVVPQYAGA